MTFVWRAVVGPAISRVTKVTLVADGTLQVVAEARWAREVERSSSVIQQRLAAALGPGIVKRIRVASKP